MEADGYMPGFKEIDSVPIGLPLLGYSGKFGDIFLWKNRRMYLLEHLPLFNDEA